MISDFAADVESLLRRVLERTLARASEVPIWFVDGAHRFYWLYLVSAVLMALVVYRWYYRRLPGTPASPWRFVFPRAVYGHPSARLDYKLALANQILGPVSMLSGVFLRGATVTAAALFSLALLRDIAGQAQLAQSPDAITSVLLFVMLTLAYDFSTYVTHWLHHRVPMLWEFHKVHHSAEVLTPVTLYRKHPVYDLLGTVTDLALVGPVQGVILFLFGVDAPVLLLMGGNALYTVFNLLGSNLRHSHVWIAFGAIAGRIVISPAAHQVHHSTAERHWNKNFGEMFAVWDWMFGTLYLPGRDPETLVFGVAGAERQEHPTLWTAYVVPLRNCGRMLINALARASRGTRGSTG